MFTPYPIIFQPIPKERVWGGEKLKKAFNVTTDRPIGEYWVLSSHPNDSPCKHHCN